MKVYAAAWWDNYYPIPDNVGGVFSNDRDAYIFLDKKRQEHREKLSEYDCYRVFTYEVQEWLE